MHLLPVSFTRSTHIHEVHVSLRHQTYRRCMVLCLDAFDPTSSPPPSHRPPLSQIARTQAGESVNQVVVWKKHWGKKAVRNSTRKRNDVVWLAGLVGCLLLAGRVEPWMRIMVAPLRQHWGIQSDINGNEMEKRLPLHERRRDADSESDLVGT